MMQRAFDSKAEFLIEPDGGHIVGVDLKLETFYVQPLLRQIDRGLC